VASADDGDRRRLRSTDGTGPPVKVGKPLSESLSILGRMAATGHVDPDLFDVFVRRKVYLAYAQRFMDPAQIDAIDLRAIPGYRP